MSSKNTAHFTPKFFVGLSDKSQYFYDFNFSSSAGYYCGKNEIRKAYIMFLTKNWNSIEVL